MEQMIAGKSEGLVIQAVQAMLPTLLKHWENHRDFRHAATPVFMREAGFSREEFANAVSVVDQTFTQVPRLHGRQFRAYVKREKLEDAYTRLVPSATDSPVRQGFLWLAFQVQAAAIDLGESEAGEAEMAKVRNAVDENKAVFQALLRTDVEKLLLGRIERVLRALTLKILGAETGNFQVYAMVGAMMEFARREARQPPGLDLLSGSGAGSAEHARQLASLIEPVHAAELNEASHRFFRLRDQAKSRWFDVLRKFLDKSGDQLFQNAPLGFERFAEAVELQLFPYPAPLEWIRAYLKPLYTNALQSSVFDNCVSEASVRQRYEKLSSEKTGNRVMIELAKAFALANLNKLEDPGQRAFIEALDFQKEFHWPATFEDLKAQLKP